jgi:hypothetical protein
MRRQQLPPRPDEQPHIAAPPGGIPRALDHGLRAGTRRKKMDYRGDNGGKNRERGRERTIELDPTVSFAICPAHCLDGMQTHRRHHEWHVNACCCTRRICEISCAPKGYNDYGGWLLDTKKGGLGRKDSCLLLASKTNVPGRDYDE